MSNKILITGATGKTGLALAKILADRKIDFKAMIRKEDSRSELLRSYNAEIVIGDFFDIHSLHKAFEGASKVYFCYPPSPNLLLAAANVATTAVKTNIAILVNMSQIIAREGHVSPLSHQHWLSENIFDWAEIGAIHVRAGLFIENLYFTAIPTAASFKKIMLPYGQGKHAPISVYDLSTAIAELLISDNPEDHFGKRYVLTGATSLSTNEIVSKINQLINTELEYQEISSKEWVNMMSQIPGFGKYQLAHFPALADDMRNQRFNIVTTHFREITGKEPESFSSFVTQNQELFTSENAVNRFIASLA